MTLVLADVLQTIKDRQWAITDIDWDAPGKHLIRDRQRPQLESFMVDLVWIETLGARGFATLAAKTTDETLAEIYRYFHAEELKHANAELALMRRWGMLPDDSVPEPNINVRLAIEWLDRSADTLSVAVLGTLLPMLECALDGALVKFLVDEVDDPVCREVFNKINADESRHLAVDFHALEMMGHSTIRKLAIEFIGGVMRPSVLIGFLVYVPLLSKMRDNIVAMGLKEERLYAAMKRFATVGDRIPSMRRVLVYEALKRHSTMMVDRDHPYHIFGDFMVRVADRFPRRLLRSMPAWTNDFTIEPAV